MTDMECISGIAHDEQVRRESPFWQQSRGYLMGDANAAVRGAFDGGADDVVVQDGHDDGKSFITELLDPRARLSVGSRDGWLGIDDTFDAAVMVGQHAKAGTLDAFLDHTQSGRDIFDFTVNGVSMGEMGQFALMAGEHGVPLIFLSGDDAACREAESFFPGIVTVSVGTAAGRKHLATLPPPVAHEKIQSGVKQALAEIKTRKVAPYTIEKPYVLELVTQKTEIADRLCNLRSNRERVDGRTVRMTVERARDILGIFV